MDSLNSFLNPKRKENLKFILSDAFVDGEGKPIQWEMRQLSAQEGLNIQKQSSTKEYMDIMVAYVAGSLVYPNLKDKDLLEGLSKKEEKTILKPVDALKALVTDAELASLINRYTEYNELTSDFDKKAEEVKN